MTGTINIQTTDRKIYERAKTALEKKDFAKLFGAYWVVQGAELSGEAVKIRLVEAKPGQIPEGMSR